MKKTVKNLSGYLSCAVPFGLIKKKQVPFLPFYHLVSNETLPHIRHLYRAITPKIFEKHLDFYLKHFQSVTAISELGKGNGFLLSFDDGLREVYEVVYPILKRKGVQAVFFINSAFVGNAGLMYRYKASLLIDKMPDNPLLKKEILQIDFAHRSRIDNLLEKFEIDVDSYLKIQKPYMNLSELKQMADDGFIIGMHGYSHSDYRQLSDEQRTEDLRKNIDWHRENFPKQPMVFAFPFTDDSIPLSFFEKMKTMGITASFGTAGIKPDVADSHFQRLPVEDYHGNIRKIAGGEFVYSAIRSIFGKNTVHRP